MRVVQCTRCKTVKLTSARTNRPQCKRVIARDYDLSQYVERCNGPMHPTDSILCWKCNEWQEVVETDGLLFCNWCGCSFTRPHVVKPMKL